MRLISKPARIEPKPHISKIQHFWLMQARVKPSDSANSRGISISLLHNRRPKGANANQHWSFLAGALQPRVLLLYHGAPVSIAGLCIIPACSICFESSCLFPILQLSKNIFFMFIITLNPSLFMPVVVSLHDSSQCLKLISTLYPAQETQTVSNLSTCF